LLAAGDLTALFELYQDPCETAADPKTSGQNNS
jgi:hypothetical protein